MFPGKGKQTNLKYLYFLSIVLVIGAVLFRTSIKLSQHWWMGVRCEKYSEFELQMMWHLVPCNRLSDLSAALSGQ